MCACTLCTMQSYMQSEFCNSENLQFDQVKGHALDPSSNTRLLLTSSINVQNFNILRLIVLELW